MEVEVETVSASPVTEAAAKAYNTFRDEVSMPGPRVAPPEPLVEDKTAKAKTEKKVVNPYTQKPYYKDNRHTFVPERDIRDGYHGFHPPRLEYYVVPKPTLKPQKVKPDPEPTRRFKREQRPAVVIQSTKDAALGHLGGAFIDFGNSKEEGKEQEDTKKKSEFDDEEISV